MKGKLLLSLFLLLNIICLQGCRDKGSSSEDIIVSKPAVTLAHTDSRVIEAYIYAYPLVLMDITKNRHTVGGALVNRFLHLRNFPDHSSNSVIRPSNDLLYSNAWLDLSSEPIIMHLPDFGSRYYLMPLMDAWSNVFASVGTRTTGNRAGDFAIVGPHWQGELPPGVTVIRSPTNIVWLLGRLYCKRTQDDLAAVHTLQDQMTLRSLGSSAIFPAHTPGPVISHIMSFIQRTPAAQVAKMDAESFFKSFARLLKDNPPPPADAAVIKKLAEIGIVSGKDFDINNLDPAVRNKLEASVSAGQSKIKSFTGDSYLANGWSLNVKWGSYGVHYLRRAYVALNLLGANLAEDAIYPNTSVDNKGVSLTGANRYVVRFPMGKTPPANAFWSLTLYNDLGYFVDNSLHRYAIHSADNLTYNTDGSLDIYIQANSPGIDKEHNWLPAPQESFNLTMRIYWPKPAALKGTWRPPVVKKIN
ncbi:MAG: DUF1254 domain-containing protein [Deltaproteobacteria bacterium]|nr:DUF1254 domain-containing protein [Deltaproteobacteria bacterium]